MNTSLCKERRGRRGTLFPTPEEYILPYIHQLISDVPYMDTKYMPGVINSFVGYRCSNSFLQCYFSTIGYLFMDVIMLNNEKTKMYITSPPKTDQYEDNEIPTSWNNLITFSQELTLQEHYSFGQLHKLLTLLGLNSDGMSIYKEKYPKEYEVFTANNPLSGWKGMLHMKVSNQPILFMNPMLHNTDPRSQLSDSHIFKENSPYEEVISLEQNPFTTRYYKYFPHGCTIEEFLVTLLELHGNPGDRWYTLYCGFSELSYVSKSKHLVKNITKIRKEMGEDGIDDKDAECLFVCFDHGS